MGANTSSRTASVPGYEKVTGIQLPGQSGKTRKMEEKIEDYMNATRREGACDDLNIMISSNSKLLVEQTSTRLHSDLGPANTLDEAASDASDEEEGEEYIVLTNGATTWTSSNKMEPKELAYDILSETVSMVVCCSNAVRYRKLATVLTLLETNRKFGRRINLWVDEAHKSIQLWKKPQYNKVLAYSKVARVTLVSASWDRIDSLYSVPRDTYEVKHPEV
jgi:hypothetical protein